LREPVAAGVRAGLVGALLGVGVLVWPQHGTAQAVPGVGPVVVDVVENGADGGPSSGESASAGDLGASVLGESPGTAAAAISALVEALRDPDAAIRAAAAVAIGDLRPLGGVDALKLILATDPDPDVKAAAAAALWRLEDDRRRAIDSGG
jgi:hypothetical protein